MEKGKKLGGWLKKILLSKPVPVIISFLLPVIFPAFNYISSKINQELSYWWFIAPCIILLILVILRSIIEYRKELDDKFQRESEEALTKKVLILESLIGMAHTRICSLSTYYLQTTRHMFLRFQNNKEITKEILVGKIGFQATCILFTEDLFSLVNRITKISDIYITVYMRTSNKEANLIAFANANRSRRNGDFDCRNFETEHKDEYFLCKVFRNKIAENIIFTEEEEIADNLYRQDRRHRKIKQYICIPRVLNTVENDLSQNESRVEFILQLDSGTKNAFGRTKEEVEKFICEYVDYYVDTMRLFFEEERLLEELLNAKNM